MKKSILICASFTVFSFLVCLISGIFLVSVPDFVLESFKKSYKILSILQFFLKILPAIVATGFVIGLAVWFGLNPEGSKTRFSSAMFSRFKKVLCFALVCTALFTFSVLIFIPLVNTKLNSYCEIKPLILEYQNLSQKLLGEEQYGLASFYARKAYEIDPKNQESYNLLKKAELKESESKNNVKPIVSENSQSSKNRNIQKRLSANRPYEVLELLKVARQCFAQEDYFGAHYNATQGLKIVSSRDMNVSELKQIASEAWNKLSFMGEKKLTEEQKIFAKKLEGYSALMNGENLRAYYIFKGLSQKSRKLSIDIDVVTYLQAAENLVKETYFFTDETYNLIGFEKYNNVSFSVQKKDGTKLVFFVKGITPVFSASENVLYLRDLTVFEIQNDQIKGGFFDSYAKLVSFDTDFFDEETKKNLGIEKFKTIPYILLKSVDRKTEGVMSLPKKIKNLPFNEEKSFELLTIDFKDLTLIQYASKGEENMDISSLFNFVFKAEKYGYSSEVYAQSLFDKLTYPFFVLGVLLVLATFSWLGRLNEGATFKFKWIVMFPFLAVIFCLIYRVLLILFKFLNFALLSFAGYKVGLVLAILIQIILILGFSVMFLAQHNREA